MNFLRCLVNIIVILFLGSNRVEFRLNFVGLGRVQVELCRVELGLNFPELGRARVELRRIESGVGSKS